MIRPLVVTCLLVVLPAVASADTIGRLAWLGCRAPGVVEFGQDVNGVCDLAGPNGDAYFFLENFNATIPGRGTIDYFGNVRLSVTTGAQTVEQVVTDPFCSPAVNGRVCLPVEGFAPLGESLTISLVLPPGFDGLVDVPTLTRDTLEGEITFTPSAVPEPSTLVLLATGAVGFLRRRSRH